MLVIINHRFESPDDIIKPDPEVSVLRGEEGEKLLRWIDKESDSVLQNRCENFRHQKHYFKCDFLQYSSHAQIVFSGVFEKFIKELRGFRPDFSGVNSGV